MQERGPVAPLSEPGGAPVPAPRTAPVGHRATVVALIVAAGVIALDQTAKSLVESHLDQPVHLVGPLGLGLAYNSGSAFSIFPGHPVVIGLIGAVLVAALVWCTWRTHRVWMGVALGLVLGGAVGNLTDRVARGHHGAVVDFITLSHWPTFNLADACITVGVILLAVLLWRGR